MMKSMLISIIMGIITKMIIMSIIKSIMNMMMFGIRRMIGSKNKIIRRKRLKMEREKSRTTRLISYHHLHNHPQPHHFSPPSTGTSSQLKSSSSALLTVLLFLRPVLPNISMTTSRLTLPSCNRYFTLLARLSVPQSAIKLPSISKI